MRRRARMDDQTTRPGADDGASQSRAVARSDGARAGRRLPPGRASAAWRGASATSRPDVANVAQQAHIQPGMFSLETGRVSPSLETIVALAEVLGIRPALLLQESARRKRWRKHTPAGQGWSRAARQRRGHPSAVGRSARPRKNSSRSSSPHRQSEVVPVSALGDRVHYFCPGRCVTATAGKAICSRRAIP